MKNIDIREAAKESGVCLWQIADVLGMADNNFSRKLRKELSDGEKSKIKSIIKTIAASNAEK